MFVIEVCVCHRPSRYLTASVDVQRKTELEGEIQVSIIML